jgi:hypothetical protein
MRVENISLCSEISTKKAVEEFPLWRILKKTILYSGFNNPYKKTAKPQENSILMNRISYS